MPIPAMLLGVQSPILHRIPISLALTQELPQFLREMSGLSRPIRSITQQAMFALEPLLRFQPSAMIMHLLLEPNGPTTLLSHGIPQLPIKLATALFLQQD